MRASNFVAQAVMGQPIKEYVAEEGGVVQRNAQWVPDDHKIAFKSFQVTFCRNRMT
jgi:hypothetical protein